MSRFQKREDGTHRIPGGDKPSIEVFLRERGTKLEVRNVETGHLFYQEWVRQGGRRIYFPFNPPKPHHFAPRMKSGERKLAAAVQRYILDAYQGSSLDEWSYPRKKDARPVSSFHSPAPLFGAPVVAGEVL